jgi:MerR family transcriptional regulator, light-induced transcriptional regulator
VPVLQPELLGLARAADPLSVPPPSAAPAGEACDRLYELLAADDAVAARAYLSSLYLAGWSLATIFDGPVRNALARIGHLWHGGGSGIVVEHRATQTCVQAVAQLRAWLPSLSADAPVAVGGAPAGDPYMIPSQMAAAVLAEAGYADRDLGPETPLPVLVAAITRYRPSLVWLAWSVEPTDVEAAADLLDRVIEAASAAGAAVLVGGRGASRLRPGAVGSFHHGASMAELAAFARGWHASASYSRGPSATRP